MNMFASLVSRPAGTSLLALGLFLAGICAYFLLGVAALPTLDVPALTVVSNLPGASAQVMANTVAAPLERHLGRIPGVSEMYSSSTDGSTTVQLQFSMDRNTDQAARDVQAAINAAQSDLPNSLPSPPQYFKFNTSSIPVLLLALTSTSMPSDQLYDKADTLLAPSIAQIAGVARVEVFGGSPHAVRIELDSGALAAKGLTTNDVANTLTAANVTSPQGLLSDGRTQMTVLANDALHEPKEFADLFIADRAGVPVRLSDVAKVSSGPQDIYQGAWFNNQKAVTIQVLKRPEANAIALSKAIRAQLPQFHLWLPADVKITPIVDLTQTTKSALGEVQVALLISIVMVVLVMLVFLRRLGPTLIATLSVPLSLAGACLVMWVFGYTLNTMSLMALVLCIGFVVDDAIVVIENIVRHMEQGQTPLQAALKGVGEIGFTVISITLSLIAVFTPLLFGNNLLVKLLREFSVTLASAVVISAMVSLTVTPALCGRYLKAEHAAGARAPSRLQLALERFDARLQRVYTRALDWSMRHRRLMRWQPLLLLLLTAVLGIAVLKTAGGGFMPEEDMGMLQGTIRADANISPSLLAARVEEVTRIMLADPGIADISTSLGGDFGGAVGARASVWVDLKPFGKGPGMRVDSAKKVTERLSKQFEKLSNVGVYIAPVDFFGAGPGTAGGQYSFQLVSHDGAELQPWALKMVRALRTYKEMRDVGSDFDRVAKQQMLQVDRATASRLGVGIGTIDSALYTAFGQNQVSVIYSDINQYRVVLTSSSSVSLSPESLLNTYVRSTSNSMIPLSAVAKVVPVIAPNSVVHEDQQEAADISYNLADKVTPDRGLAIVRQAALKIGLPGGISVDSTGANKRMEDLQSNGGSLLIGAIMAMYIVLGILYESLGHPLTILSTLPAAGAGAFLAMLVTHTQLTLMAIIAVLLLIGIVKKNAIMMVDFALVAERERGLPAPEAIREAALVRFRPITMTTLVAIGAALPLAIGFGIGAEMRQPLGIAIVGGLLVSQLLTLLSTPAIYLWNHDRKQRRDRRRERRQAKRALKLAPQT